MKNIFLSAMRTAALSLGIGILLICVPGCKKQNACLTSQVSLLSRKIADYEQVKGDVIIRVRELKSREVKGLVNGRGARLLHNNNGCACHACQAKLHIFVVDVNNNSDHNFTWKTTAVLGTVVDKEELFERLYVNHQKKCSGLPWAIGIGVTLATNLISGICAGIATSIASQADDQYTIISQEQGYKNIHKMFALEGTLVSAGAHITRLVVVKDNSGIGKMNFIFEDKDKPGSSLIFYYTHQLFI